MTDYGWSRWVPALVIAWSAPLLAAPAPDDLASVAESFARGFVDGRHADNLELMTAEMRAASGPEASEPLRQGLAAQHGEVRGIGTAWLEDRVQGYLRYRVPVSFEKSVLDFRVVFDGDGHLAGFFIVPHAEPPRALEPAQGRETGVRVGEGEAALPATLTLPAAEGPFPGVVLVHGSGPHDRDETIGPNKPFRDLAAGLAERGVASLRYDKRSYARPGDLVALGDALTVHEEVVADARAALRVLRERKEIDASRVFVLGHSLGGTLLPRIAAAEPRPAGLISLAGSTLPLPEKILTQTRYIASLDGEVSAQEQARIDAVERSVRSLREALDGRAPPPETSMLGAPFGYYEDLDAYDPPARARELGLPILVLHGERDYQVTLEDFERWSRALGGKPFACLATYPRLDHLFRAGEGPSGPADYERQEPVDPAVIGDIAAWIADRTCPQPAGGD